MRVPVRRLPQTRVSEQQQGFARAAPLDISPITQGADSITEAIQGYREQLRREQLDRQKFDANKRLMKEVNELQSDFVARQRDPEISPTDFADSTNVAYEARHKAILDELDNEGFDREVIDELDLKLSSVRQGFYERGLGHQIAALESRAEEQVEDVIRNASQYTAANHNGFASASETLRESIWLIPDLTERRKEELFDQGLGVLRDAGKKSMAIQDPQFVIDTLDPQGFTAPRRSSTAAVRGTVAAPVGSWQGVATTVADELDLDPVEVAAVMSYETAGTFSPTIVGGKNNNYMGLIQFGRPERKKYGITKDSTPEQWTKAILDFMRDRGFKKGMSLLDFYSTINAGSPGRYNASDGPGNTVRGHVNKLLREHKDKASKWLASVQAEVAPSPTPESETAGVPALAPVSSITEAKTGNALLDSLNGPERIELVMMAREQLNKVSTSLKAEMDVTIDNFIAEVFANGGESGSPMPTQEQVLSAYSNNPLEGAAQWARLQQAKDSSKAIVTFRTQSVESIQQGLAAIKPRAGSPTYAAELQIYEAAEKAAQHLLQERQSDPAAYAMKYFPSVGAAAKRGTSQYYAELDRVYETLGIDSNRAPLLSDEATQQIVGDYKLMSPPQKLQFHRENFAGMGEDRFRRFVSNMEGTTAQDDARIYALLKTYPGAPGEVANVYMQVLEGREIMAKDPARRPSSDTINKQFRAEGLSAITNLNADASAAIQEAAAALYVVRGGNPDPLKFDTTLYREALKTALGGSLPAALGQGQVKDYTILPPRITRQRFQQWAERQTFESLTTLSVEKRPPRYGDLKTLAQTEDIVDHGVFVMVAPGQYIIKMSGDGKSLMTSTGNPFVVNIHARDMALTQNGSIRQIQAPPLRGVGR